MDRNLHIDAMKGFAILLVVLGHSLQSNIIDFDNNIIFRLIYSFHMGLFMFLSGYLANPNGNNFLKRKFIKLVIPFISWYLVSFFITESYKTVAFFDYIIKWIISPDYGLWFLWVLFLCHCTLYISCKVSKYIGDISFAIIVLAVNYIPYNILAVGLLKFHFIFFAVGYLVAKYKEYLMQYKSYLIMLAPILFILLFPFWHRTENPGFYQGLGIIFKYLHLPSVGKIVIIFRYIVAFSGIIVSYQLIKYICRFRYLSNAICWLGVYTFEIYVIHQSLLGIGFGTGVVRIISTMSVAVFSSLVIAWALKKVPIASMIFYGVKHHELPIKYKFDFCKLKDK